MHNTKPTSEPKRRRKRKALAIRFVTGVKI